MWWRRFSDTRNRLPSPMLSPRTISGWTAALLLTVAVHAQRGPKSHTTPSAQTRALVALLDPIMEEAVAKQQIPGGVLLVGHNRRVIYRRAFGERSLDPVSETMTTDTIFDLAS